MSIQMIELDGRRYVIIPERDFLSLKDGGQPAPVAPASMGKFKEVVPLVIRGETASEMLLRERR